MKPIETITTGDMVWAADLDMNVQLQKVTNTFENESNELIHIYIADEEIVTTPTHPFWVSQKGWTEATHLRVGDILVLVNGNYVVVELIYHEFLETPIIVYNFEVENCHTYFVGNNSILVHNKCEKMGNQKGKAPWNNQAQNKQFDSVVKEYGLTKTEARILHDEITGQGYSRSEIIDELLTLFPEKGR